MCHYPRTHEPTNSQIHEGFVSAGTSVGQHQWKQAILPSGKDADKLFIDVPVMTSAMRALTYQGPPVIVTSLSTDHMHWKVTGAGSIYNAKNSSFRLYLKPGTLGAKIFEKFPNLYRWKVKYIAYAGAWETPCVVSPWQVCLLIADLS